MGKKQWQNAMLWLWEHSNHTTTLQEALQAIKYCQDNPKDVKEPDSEHGSMPLHWAAQRQHGEHSVAVIKALLKAWPEAAGEKKGDSAYLPLHFAAESQKGEHGAAVVMLLLAAYPRGAQERRSNGNLPWQDAHVDLPASCVAALKKAAEDGPLPGSHAATAMLTLH